MKRIILALLFISTLGYSAGRIYDSDIATNAAIALSKLAAQTAHRVAVFNSSGFLAALSAGTAGQCLQSQGDGVAPTWGACGGSSDVDFNYLYLSSGNGHGAVNTKVRRYSDVNESVGTAITHNVGSDGNNGTIITVTEDGTYGICASDVYSAGNTIISIVIDNATTTPAPTTNASTPITFAQGNYGLVGKSGSGQMGQVCAFPPMSAGDTIWIQDDGNNNSSNQKSYVMVAKISDSQESHIFLNNGNGWGSSANRVRRFSNVQVNDGGSDFSVAQSAGSGDRIDITSPGKYIICYGDRDSANGGLVGIVTNFGGATTTSPPSISFYLGLRGYDQNGNNSDSSFGCWGGYLEDNISIYPQGAGTANSTNEFSFFSITKVGNQTDVSEVRLNNANGQGSAATKVQKHTNLFRNNGPSLSVTQNAIMGDNIQVDEDGIYFMCAIGNITTGQPTSSIRIYQEETGTVDADSLLFGNGLRALNQTSVNNTTSHTCAIYFMNRGSRVVSQTRGSNSGTQDWTYMFGMRAY